MTKEEKREYDRKRYLANRERILEQKKEYHQANKDKRLEYNKKYRQSNRERILEYQKQYYQANKETVLERQKEQKKEWYQANREKILEQKKEYSKTPMGRALHLLSGYNKMDRESNRGKGDLTARWIVENIFSQPCAHCGKEGWDVIGCNRIDNDKPHTKDNVEPCCFKCNAKVSGGRPRK